MVIRYLAREGARQLLKTAQHQVPVDGSPPRPPPTHTHTHAHAHTHTRGKGGRDALLDRGIQGKEGRARTAEPLLRRTNGVSHVGATAIPTPRSSFPRYAIRSVPFSSCSTPGFATIPHSHAEGPKVVFRPDSIGFSSRTHGPFKSVACATPIHWCVMQLVWPGFGLLPVHSAALSSRTG